MAKNGWKLSKVAITGSTRSLLAETAESGCWPMRYGQEDSLALLFQVHSFLAKKAPGAHVFGYCPFILSERAAWAALPDILFLFIFSPVQ